MTKVCMCVPLSVGIMLLAFSFDAAGLTLYIWIVAVVVIATGMLVTITGVMIILTANRLHSRVRL